MESIDLDMNDVFGEEADDDVGALGALPDLPESTQVEDNEDADNEEVNKRLKALSKGAAKKVVRRPQPKLDASRLTGERGIPILPKIGEKLKYKGKNHEAEDLGQIMRHMEHWAHRLFPKMTFDEVIERVERLGSKGPVKTCVKKIRLDMPIFGDEFAGSDNEDAAEQLDEDTDKVERNAESMWDDLLEEEAELRAMEEGQNRQSTRTEETSMEMAIQEEESNLTTSTPEMPGLSQSVTPSQTPSQKGGNSGTFTPEQLERMERNRQMALERKLRKSGIASPALKKTAPCSSPAFTATPLRDADSSASQESSQTSIENSDNLLSEVISQGPSQNIVIGKKQDDAQRWCTQTDNTEDNNTNVSSVTDSQEPSQHADNLTQGTSQSADKLDPASEAQDKMEVDIEHTGHNEREDCSENVLSGEPYSNSSKALPKNAREIESQVDTSSVKSAEMTNFTEFNGFNEDQSKTKTEDSEDLSEIVPAQTSQNIVLKPLICDNVDISTQSKINVSKTDLTKQVNLNDSTENKENAANLASQDKKVNGTGPDVDNNIDIDSEFDDELNEEQLMESLDQ